MPRLILPGDSPGPEYRYVLVDVEQIEPSDLVVSNGLNPEVQKNPAYPLGAQGRVYGRGSRAGDVMVAAVQRGRIDYLLDRTATPAFGPPVVVTSGDGGRLLVVAGHQRAATLRYQSRIANPKFWGPYAQAVQEMYPELSHEKASGGGHKLAVVRLLDVHWAEGASGGDELIRALRVLNRLSDAPVTKPRDALAVVKGLAEEVADLSGLRSILASALPSASELLEEEDGQHDAFRSASVPREEEVAKGGNATRSSSVNTTLHAIGKRLDSSAVQEKLYSLLFRDSQLHRIGSAKLKVPLLTEPDELAVYRRSGDRLVLTEEAKQAFAYLAVAVGLGGRDVIERLAEVRELFFSSGRDGALPGRESLPWALEVSRALIASSGFKSMASAGMLRLLGDTVLVELALHDVVRDALRQPVLGGDSRSSFSWVGEVMENAVAVRSYEQLRVNRVEWQNELRSHRKLPGNVDDAVTSEINQRLDELRHLLKPEAPKTKQPVLVMLVIRFLKTKGVLPKAKSGQRRAPKRGRGRPRVEQIDIAFSLFCLAALTSWPRKRIPTCLDRLRESLESGLSRYQEWQGEHPDLMEGSTLGYAKLHKTLRSDLPSLGREELPKLVGERSLRDALRVWSAGVSEKEADAEIKRLWRIVTAGRNAAKGVHFNWAP